MSYEAGVPTPVATTHMRPERIIIRQPTYTSVQTFKPFDSVSNHEFPTSTYKPILETQYTQWVNQKGINRKRK